MFVWVWFWSKPLTQSDWHNIWWCMLPALALTLNNVSIFFGVTIKSPFYVNIGTLLGIPLAFVVDIFVHGYSLQFLPILGAVLLIISFLMLEVIPPPKQLKFLSVALLNKHSASDENAKVDDEQEHLVKPLMRSYGGDQSAEKALSLQ